MNSNLNPNITINEPEIVEINNIHALYWIFIVILIFILILIIRCFCSKREDRNESNNLRMIYPI